MSKNVSEHFIVRKVIEQMIEIVMITEWTVLNTHPGNTKQFPYAFQWLGSLQCTMRTDGFR